MEPLRLIFGLLFAVMSVGVLVFPVNWPFSHTANSSLSFSDIHDETASLEVQSPVVKLASIPTETVLSVSPITPNKFIEDQVSMAKYLSAEKKFDDALNALSKLPTADQDHYEVVFLRARILSWAGRHEAAEQKFRRLMAKYPNDTDLMLSYGYLQFYQGKNTEAENAFKRVLEINPDYNDARDGLIKARKAM